MKRTANQILTDLKKKKKRAEKKNYTFRLNITLMEDFVKKCEKSDEGVTDVLHEMIEDFVAG